MFETLEEEKKYIMNGDLLCNDVKRQIGMLLLDERVQRRLALSALSDKIGIPPYKIELIEMARRKFHWQAVAELLRFYGKKIELRLIDVE
ncbi:MAG: hypothetical protein J6J35_02485 [Alphaproteobacteria bacterium]|nr:hypothetical protein [Alphaproteobacteria bacterium]MBP3687214.1 hypothetical protein [Alphaproteobacteria bacterium]